MSDSCNDIVNVVVFSKKTIKNVCFIILLCPEEDLADSGFSLLYLGHLMLHVTAIIKALTSIISKDA